MNIFKSKKLLFITFVYWFLLVYIVAIIVFWFISLEKQNRRMTEYKYEQLKLDDPFYQQKADKIDEEERRKTTQYVGEGIIFLVVIMIGAVFVYRATRRQFRLSLQQHNFMMSVTHELKTPVSVIMLNLETLQKRKLDEAQQQRLITNTIEENNRLNTLCNNILLASRLDAGDYKLTRTKINLSALAQAGIQQFIKSFPHRSIESSVQEDIYITGEELLLQIMMNNLIENALKYSPKGASIKIVLEENGSRICFRVLDEGPGIDDHERKKIFDKFYRIGNEVTRSAKGTGLGLYLCKKIVHDHEGEITVTDNRPQGSVFAVSFKTS